MLLSINNRGRGRHTEVVTSILTSHRNAARFEKGVKILVDKKKRFFIIIGWLCTHTANTHLSSSNFYKCMEHYMTPLKCHLIGVEHCNTDSFTLLVKWIRWRLIELSPKRICHGRLALLGPHGDAISPRLDASLTKTEEVAKVLDLQKK